MNQWSIIRCVGTRERHVADELRRGLGLHSYHPQEKTKIVRGSKMIEAERPLIPCYLFVLDIAPSVWRDVRATRGVIGWVPLAGSDEPASITDAERLRIVDLEHEFNRLRFDRLQYRALCVGDRVRINKGPFADMETLLTAVKGSKVEFRGPWGKATAPAASVSLVA